jgi:hypothetical protein
MLETIWNELEMLELIGSKLKTVQKPKAHPPHEQASVRVQERPNHPPMCQEDVQKEGRAQ